MTRDDYARRAALIMKGFADDGVGEALTADERAELANLERMAEEEIARVMAPAIAALKERADAARQLADEIRNLREELGL